MTSAIALTRQLSDVPTAIIVDALPLDGRGHSSQPLGSSPSRRHNSPARLGSRRNLLPGDTAILSRRTCHECRGTESNRPAGVALTLPSFATGRKNSPFAYAWRDNVRTGWTGFPQRISVCICPAKNGGNSTARFPSVNRPFGRHRENGGTRSDQYVSGKSYFERQRMRDSLAG